MVNHEVTSLMYKYLCYYSKRLRAGRSGVRTAMRADFRNASTLARMPTQPPVQWLRTIVP